MTNQFPPSSPDGYTSPGQPAPYPPPAQPAPPSSGQPVPPPGQPSGSPSPAPKRGNALTSKPVIGVVALVAGLALGAGAGSAGKQAPVTAAAPAPTVTVTATVEASADPTEEPTSEATETPTEDAAPTDTSFKWGRTVGFTYEDIEISVKVEAPKRSTNMFDKDNLETRLTVCNKGSDAISEMSAQGLGLYAEDKSGGQFTLMGAYRSPEFPVYSYDSAKLKAGKCRTGWISFEDAQKAVRIATDVNDTTYSWSKSGK